GLEVLLGHRPLRPIERQQRVRVLDRPRADAAVELLEGVVGAVDSLGRAHATLTIASGNRRRDRTGGPSPDGHERGEPGAARVARGGGGRGGRPRPGAPCPHARGAPRVPQVLPAPGRPPAAARGWLVRVVELAAGPSLVFGFLTPLGAAAVTGVAAVAWVANHRDAGFFVFKRPTEGWEYVMVLTVLGLAIGALGPGEWS